MRRIRLFALGIASFIVSLIAALFTSGTWLNRAIATTMCTVFSFNSAICTVDLARSSDRVVAATPPAMEKTIFYGLGDLLARDPNEFGGDQPTTTPPISNPQAPASSSSKEENPFASSNVSQCTCWVEEEKVSGKVWACRAFNVHNDNNWFYFSPHGGAPFPGMPEGLRGIPNEPIAHYGFQCKVTNGKIEQEAEKLELQKLMNNSGTSLEQQNPSKFGDDKLASYPSRINPPPFPQDPGPNQPLRRPDFDDEQSKNQNSCPSSGSVKRNYQVSASSDKKRLEGKSNLNEQLLVEIISPALIKMEYRDCEGKKWLLKAEKNKKLSSIQTPFIRQKFNLEQDLFGIKALKNNRSILNNSSLVAVIDPTEYLCAACDMMSALNKKLKAAKGLDSSLNDEIPGTVNVYWKLFNSPTAAVEEAG